METLGPSHESTDRPDQAQASAALREAERARASLAGTPAPPWWYFGTLAALVAVVPVVTYAPATALGITLTLVGLVVWMSLVGIVVGAYVRKAGVVPRITAVPRRLLALPIGALVAMAVAAVLVNTLGQTWIWFVVSGGIAVVLLAFGARVRRYARATA